MKYLGDYELKDLMGIWASNNCTFSVLDNGSCELYNEVEKKKLFIGKFKVKPTMEGEVYLKQIFSPSSDIAIQIKQGIYIFHKF